MFETFETAESYYYGKWYGEMPDYEEALKVALWCYETYPEHRKQIMLDLGILYYKVGETEASAKIFNKALDMGVWYPKEFLDEFWDEPWFGAIAWRWMNTREKDVAECEVLYHFMSTKTLSKDKPVFLALHGWGEDIALFKQFWQSSQLKEAYNTVFVQSSQMIGAYHYKWTDYEWAKKDIRKVLSVLAKEYGLQTDQIYVGGFSEGATTALKLAIEGSPFNIKGFIALNPNKPSEMTAAIVEQMKASGIKGGIITGDMDQCYAEQLEMKALFNGQGMPCEWIVTENFGHWFPKDLDKKIDKVLLTFNN